MRYASVISPPLAFQVSTHDAVGLEVVAFSAEVVVCTAAVIKRVGGALAALMPHLVLLVMEVLGFEQVVRALRFFEA